MIGVDLSSALIATGVAAALIGALALAIRRSARRLECARMRDQLMDAARAGRLDLTDWRMVSLIDWFDQVATTGRTDLPGRHTGERPDPADSLALSLATTLLPLGSPDPADAAWQASWPDPEPDPVDDIRAEAIAYRERHQSRARYRPRHQTSLRHRTPDVTGHARPDDALALMEGWEPALPLVPGRSSATGGAVDLRDSAGRPVPVTSDVSGVSSGPPRPRAQPSLVEEIFAVAGSGR